MQCSMHRGLLEPQRMVSVVIVNTHLVVVHLSLLTGLQLWMTHSATWMMYASLMEVFRFYTATILSTSLACILHDYKEYTCAH